MSLESWRQEYYPVEAHKVGKKDAIKHSLQKWKGLRLQVLLNHGLEGKQRLVESGANIATAPSFHINASSCALCHHYLTGSTNHHMWPCGECPLKLIRGTTCDREGADRSPYGEYAWHGNPEPMIALLTKAAEIEEGAK